MDAFTGRTVLEMSEVLQSPGRSLSICHSDPAVVWREKNPGKCVGMDPSSRLGNSGIQDDRKRSFRDNTTQFVSDCESFLQISYVFDPSFYVPFIAFPAPII